MDNAMNAAACALKIVQEESGYLTESPGKGMHVIVVDVRSLTGTASRIV